MSSALSRDLCPSLNQAAKNGRILKFFSASGISFDRRLSLHRCGTFGLGQFPDAIVEFRCQHILRLIHGRNDCVTLLALTLKPGIRPPNFRTARRYYEILAQRKEAKLA